MRNRDCPERFHVVTRLQKTNVCVKRQTTIFLYRKFTAEFNQFLSVLKVFELLLTFCTVAGLRSLVCKALLTPANSKPKDPNVNSSYDIVLYWVNQSVDTHSTVSIKALDFIKEIYEVRVIGFFLLRFISEQLQYNHVQ